LRNCLLAAVVSVAALLCMPATSLAKNHDGGAAAKPVTVLSSAGLLAYGEGYGVTHGSRAVRALQLRLQASSVSPGPIDGLFGPLTQAAVRRFQQKHGLAADGIVGPQTRKPLLAQPAARRGRPEGGRPAATRPDPPERARSAGLPNDAPRRDGTPRERPIALEVPSVSAPEQAVRAAPPSPSGISPWIAAALGALGAGLVIGALRLRASRRHGGPETGAALAPRLERSDRRLSLGMVSAALLAVFAVGAAVGALFAVHAADDGRASSDEPRAALLPAKSTAQDGAEVKGERDAERLGHP
jgi:peptidoglycan hydrolase-like protein with peptidoglycan-binding domain